MKKKFKTLLEFIKQEETEYGAIPLLEHGRFAKEISKLAKKFGFDCYAKGYPKEKIDYVPSGKTYNIKTIEEIAQLSPQQFEFFTDDLREFCNARRLINQINEASGVDILKAQQEGIIWIDSGLNEAKIQFETSNKI